MPKFFQYSDILLKTYFDIANSGDYKKVLISGKASIDQCKTQWNKIVEENFSHSGSTFDFINYIDTVDSYNHFLQEHNVITAQLVILHFQVDKSIIANLAEKGYVIDTSGRTAYLASLIAAVKRSRSILSRLKMKSNELEIYNRVADKEAGKPATFDDVMVSLIMNLGQHVSDDITLARYNQFRRKIEEQRKRQDV